jgi:signal transduction histidine kinase
MLLLAPVPPLVTALLCLFILVAFSFWQHWRQSSARQASLLRESEALRTQFSDLESQYEQTRRSLREANEQLERLNEIFQIQYEQLDEINKERDNFVYRTSHDLKGPINSVIGLIALIRLETSEEARLDLLTMQELALCKLKEKIAELLEHARQKSIVIGVMQEEISFKKIVEDVFFQHKFMENARSMRMEVVCEQEDVFYSDAKLVEAVVMNLVSNSIKYANLNQLEPFIEVKVTTTAHQACLKVIDNGIGISAEHRDKVFAQFYQVAKTEGSNGFGLSAVQDMVRKMKGTVELESEVGKGTTITITLPSSLRKTENKPQRILA